MIKILLMLAVVAAVYFGVTWEGKPDNIGDSIEMLEDVKNKALELKDNAVELQQDAADRIEEAKKKIDDVRGD